MVRRLVRRKRSHNPEVAGSNPAPATSESQFTRPVARDGDRAFCVLGSNRQQTHAVSKRGSVVAAVVRESVDASLRSARCRGAGARCDPTGSGGADRRHLRRAPRRLAGHRAGHVATPVLQRIAMLLVSAFRRHPGRSEAAPPGSHWGEAVDDLRGFVVLGVEVQGVLEATPCKVGMTIYVMGPTGHRPGSG